MDSQLLYLGYYSYLVIGLILALWSIMKQPAGYSQRSTFLLLALTPINLYFLYKFQHNCIRSDSGCEWLFIEFFTLLFSAPLIFGLVIILYISLVDSKNYFTCQKCGEPSYLNSVITEKTICAECKKT
ncbi:MAG: hypothetical protein ACJAS1_001467 [Oleiphilaceae bacterium]|jgi:hypothetical protein